MGYCYVLEHSTNHVPFVCGTIWDARFYVQQACAVHELLILTMNKFM